MKKRIDILLVEKNIAETRSKAQAMIMDGRIYINRNKVLKSSESHNILSKITYTNLQPDWVSRGALKLLHAINYFQIDIKNFICIDLGASTGGFTDVLLHEKVKKVYCVDVGTNQLHQKIKNNKKVINISKMNAKFVNKEIIPELVDLIVCDVSFISMKKVINPSILFLKKNSGHIVGLIKPQFESEKKNLQRGGVITDGKIHEKICKDYKDWFESNFKMQVQGIIRSPIKGPKGNIEFLIYAKR